MNEWGIERRKLYEDLGRIGNYDGSLDLIFPDDNEKHDPLTKLELFGLETQIMGLSTEQHIMSFYEDWMRKKRILGVDELGTVKDRQYVQIAGATIMHQAPPTARGYHFVMLEGKRGMIQMIVRPSVYKRFRHIIRHAPLLWITGKLQREGDVTNILCESATNLPNLSSHT
jgi:error-prone DNA polymerase